MKKILLSALTLTFTLNVFSQIPTNNITAFYPFSGNTLDASGHSNNGVNNGATLTTDRFGIANSAYQFDGSSSYIYISNPILPNSSTSYSINFWALNMAGNNNGTVICDRDGASCGYKYSAAVDNTGKYGFGMHIPSPWTFNSVSSANTIPNNQWEMITCVFDKDSSLMKYYENGLLVGMHSNSIWNGLSNGTTIGALKGCGISISNFYNGKIDDIRVYDTVLTASNINAMYTEGLCIQNISVTDTLFINANFTGFNPIVYANTIKMYPNPANTDLIIDYGNNFSYFTGYTLKIENSLSQVVYQTGITQQSATINLSSWTGNGLYFVHLIDNSGHTVDIRKIVLQ